MTKRSKQNLLTDLAPWALNLGLAATLMSCGGSTGSGTTQTSCYSTSTCSADNSLNKDTTACTSSSTTTCTASTGGDTNKSSDQAADHTFAANNALGAAGDFVSAKPAGSAATASDLSPASKTGSSAANLASNQPATGGGASLPSGGGSGGGSSSPSSSGGGAGDSLGGVSTSPASGGGAGLGSAATAGGVITAGNNPGGGGSYSGGGGGMARSGGGSNPFLSGDSSGLSASGAHAMDFNGTRDPASGQPTAGTTDPSDYFSRLGERDNLFKVVERRYQKTTMNWAEAAAALKK